MSVPENAATVELAGQPAEVHVYAIDMRVPVRGLTVREGVIIERAGIWSEWSPDIELDDAAAARWLGESVTVSTPQLQRASIPLSVTIPALEAEQAAELARESSCVTATVVVADPAFDDDADVRRVAAVRAALGGHGKLRVDAAGQWSVERAVEMLSRLAEYDLQFVEQPVATYDEMRQLRDELLTRGLEIEFAADELINADPTNCDPAEIQQIAQYAVLKTHALGGVNATVDLAAQFDIPMVISSACETSIGLHAGIRAAACLPTMRLSNELDTIRLLTGDVVSKPLASQYGAVRVAGRPRADKELLARYAADQDRTAWWLERLTRCAALVG